MAVSAVPKVFVSYSHDDQQHKDWVLQLATRLVANGVDILLDQWDLALGGDLPRFIEHGLSDADRILAVCTERYVEKSNDGAGTVGYEKMILTGDVVRNVNSNRIIPVVRNNSLAVPVPTFLSSKIYVDFRDDLQYESKYAELVRDIHGVGVKPRPPLGLNPFLDHVIAVAPLISFGPERYVSPALSGRVTFDYSNNNGRFVVGAGDMAFETAWSGGSEIAIHAYSDPPSIRSVALAAGISEIDAIGDPTMFDPSSRVRSPRLGEIVIWKNTAGYYLATKVEMLATRSHGDSEDSVTFSYVIASNKSAPFSGGSTIA